MTELAQLRSMLEVLLRRVDELHKLVEPQHAPLTRVAFAKLANYSVRTIQNKIGAGEITTLPDGRIPYKELRRFLS